ncbi:MAG: IclR family transcriptional regulator [Beijerinckiaceae bacterium]|jgi:DNA-binding IclR family transcriptional regulator|nr:IclR family transcriptional regulator [Beijerinckiaceae bacterium]
MKSVRNAMKALELFIEQNPSVSVSQVSEHLGLPRSSASRLMSAMRESGMIEQEQKGGHYRPGLLAYRLGSAYAAHRSPRETMRSAMQELATQTRHSCWLSTLSGTEISILEGIHGGYPIRLVVEIGSQLPAHATAGGKALLARKADAQVRALFGQARLEGFTDRTITSVEDLLAELAVIRHNKWAATNQEMIEGITSYAISIRIPAEGIDFAISVSFPVTNVSQSDAQKLQETLLSIGKGIGQKLGDLFWA